MLWILIVLLRSLCKQHNTIGLRDSYLIHKNVIHRNGFQQTPATSTDLHFGAVQSLLCTSVHSHIWTNSAKSVGVATFSKTKPRF